MNQCIRLVESLTKFSKTRPVNEVKQAMAGIVSVLGNIRMVYLRCFLEYLPLIKKIYPFWIMLFFKRNSNTSKKRLLILMSG
jgi:hypothetical protein